MEVGGGGLDTEAGGTAEGDEFGDEGGGGLDIEAGGTAEGDEFGDGAVDDIYQQPTTRRDCS